jgi:hypothetical protein
MRDAMSPEVKAALEQCRWMINKGSKSFSLAARSSIVRREGRIFLYGWCRYCGSGRSGWKNAESN